MNEKKTIELADLDWEDRERVLRLMFSKMNSGAAPSNWRSMELSTRNGRTTGGIVSKGTRGEGMLDQSFREGDDEYDQEVEGDNISNTNIFRKTNADEYGGSAVTTHKASST